MGRLLPLLKARFFDANGEPLSGGKLYSYQAGTTTPLATYSDNETTPNTNPVILDANGEADVWLAAGSNYKFRLFNSADVLQWEVDNIPGTVGSSSSSGSEGWSAFVEHAVTDGQSATNLSAETVDSDDYSSAIYEVEIIRGTTVVSSGRLAIQDVNGTWEVNTGFFTGSALHGVTFSVSQSGTVAQLRAALDAGAGDGTIKLSRKLISA